MTDEAAAMTPEERLSHDLCCECGTALTGIDAAHHSAQHWPQFIRPDGLNAEAIRRQGLMADYAQAHPAPAHRQAGSKPSSSSSQPASSESKRP